MDIQILGPGCANCLKLEMLVMETPTERGIREARVDKILTLREMECLMTGNSPGLVINGQLVWSGGITFRRRHKWQNGFEVAASTG